jgi:SOS-response transcriptional repressor LexA
MSALDEAFWSAFMAEARELLAIDPASMSAEQLGELDALSDAFIHLVGYSESLRRERIPESDLRLVDELRLRERLGSLRSRRTARAANQRGQGAEALTDEDRRLLRDRILGGLHGQQLRVREAMRALVAHPIEPARLPRPAALREMEAQHRALVVPELAIAAGLGAELWDVECTSAVDVPRDLPRAPYLALRVAGDSMEPLIHSGDMVLVRVEERVTRGTVVVARDPEHGYVVKEVGYLTSAEIELRSLNPAFSPMRVPQRGGVVLGTVVMRWRGPLRAR